jgi:hypothetical protein
MLLKVFLRIRQTVLGLRSQHVSKVSSSGQNFAPKRAQKIWSVMLPIMWIGYGTLVSLLEQGGGRKPISEAIFQTSSETSSE